jgi:hypothetical protein
MTERTGGETSEKERTGWRIIPARSNVLLLESQLSSYSNLIVRIYKFILSTET